MGIVRFLPPDEFVYRLTVGDVAVEHRISSIKQLWLIAYTHDTEREILEELSETISDDDLFLDIGANVGVYAALAGAAGAAVSAVEPLQQNSALAKRSLERNCSEFTVLPFAVGADDDVAELETSGIGTIDDRASLGDGDVTVTVLRGDRLVETYLDRVPSIVKIDVEGAEQAVLEGLAETLDDDRCRRTYVEVHVGSTDAEAAIDAVRSQLETHGFAVSVLEERDQSGDAEADQVFVVGEK